MRSGRGLGTLVLALLACGVASADKVDVQQFHPAATSSDFLGLDEATVLPHLRGAVALTLSDGHDALVLRDMGTVVPYGHIVEHQIWLEAAGSVGLFERFEVGVDLPIALYQGGDGAPPSGFDVAGTVRNQRGASLGDLRLDGKTLLIDRYFGRSPGDRQHRITFSLVTGLSFPTATKDLAGENNVAFRPRLVVEYAWKRMKLVLSAGAVFRARGELVGLDVGHQITAGVGGIVAIWKGLELQGETRVAATVSAPHGYHFGLLDAPTELDVGIAYRTNFGFRGWLAAGGALDQGYGAPQFRVMLGARYVIPEMKRELPWSEQDADHDGILNGVDHCISEAGPAANGGCADTDFDGDGVIDRLDKCPDRVGLRVNDGCPDIDSDGDGIVDRLDRCPKTRGIAKNDGCPAQDIDGDGMPDSIDKCPDQPGPIDHEGCPIDSDHDGRLDPFDKCPNEAEVYNGVDDDDGCPDDGAPLVELVPGAITLAAPITFDKDAVGERIAQGSMKVLGALGALLRAHGELLKVRIDGHTDDRGDAMDNLELSLVHAQLVRRWLIDSAHIDATRLTAEGFGDKHPLVENKTNKDRARNRRIEVIVLDVAR